ncbi:hypothetical protein Syun_016007 [Stephania yunnanensis]|uniref:Uncharacterized protein n=1 Tax=Stephania yunnanensis TaxID=152371 RepID=A0AAP0P3H0_9MAGN
MRDMQRGDEGREGGVQVAMRAHVPLGVRADVAKEKEHVSLLQVQTPDRRRVGRD